MSVIVIQIIALFIFMHAFFVFATLKKRNDIADVAWGLGFVLLALIGAGANPTTRSLLIALIVSVWGLRLAGHIGARFRKSAVEDKRYQAMRAGWKGSAVFNGWYRVFMLQGTLLLMVAAGIIIVASSDRGGFNAVNILGLLVWLFGFVFEAVGDRQLKAFVANPENRGRVMQTGLWRYTRHPNYFGEAVLWWGVWLMVWGAPYSWLALLGPLTITVLLRYVSGVPLAEKRYAENREFIDYAKKTPAMLPNFFIKQ